MSSVVLALPALAQVPVAPAQPAPTTVPTSTRVTSTAPPAAAPAAATAESPAPGSVEKARQGVVRIERQGKPLALGAVLEGDGRVLTSLSALGTAQGLSARYHDGAVVQLKLAHQDRSWDLALLAVVPGKAPLRTAGLRAARTPSFTGLQTFGASTNTLPVSLQVSPGLVGSTEDALPLNGAYDVSLKIAQLGAPVVNAEGDVVALIAQACAAGGAARCVPTRYGAPVAALKQFLKRVPAEATWLGIEATPDDTRAVKGLRVVSIVPGSPAASAGLRPGGTALTADLVVAVDGTPVSTPAELNEAVRARVVGDSVELLLFGNGRYRHVTVKPAPAPQLTAPPYSEPPKPTKSTTPNPYR